MILVTGLGAIFFIWLIIVTWLIFKTRAHYLNLVATTRKEKLDDILGELLVYYKENKKEISDLQKNIKTLSEGSDYHFQKLGIVRFNPFENRGGQESFVISLLDRKNNGLLMNFIYTREGLRVYTKSVKKGASVTYQLTKEENAAIEKSE